MDISKDKISLVSCRQAEHVWTCPEETCRKALSRKQTLVTHIKGFHPQLLQMIDEDTTSKRYKQYETDHTIPVPRTTLFNRQKRNIRYMMANWISTLTLQTWCFGRIDIQRHVKDSEVYEDSSENTTNSSDTQTTQQLGTDNGICGQDLLDQVEIERCGDSGDECSESESSSDMSISSDDDENESNNSNCEHKMCSDNDPPLYVIPSQEEVYSSPITASEHALALGAVATRHNLSNAAISDILQLIQLHIPTENIGLTSMNALKDVCGFSKDYLKYQVYCELCKKTFSDDVEICPTPGCHSVNTADSKKYFVKSDIRLQLREILERPETWETIKESYSLEPSSVLSDVKAGSAYQKLKEPGGFLHDSTNITVSMFTDGVALFKSSSVSLWPIYLLINELPPKERFHKKNMILWGIWQGVGKPKMLMFFQPFVTDLLDLYRDGFTFRTVMGDIVRSKIMLLVATMDLQARAYVLNMTQHNGESACVFCTEKGETVKSGAGHCRAYPYQETGLNLRTEQEIRASAAKARATGGRVDGFYGESALMFLPYFKLSENVVIDYMHGILLGVTKKLLELWFDNKNNKEEWYLGDNVKLVDKRLTKIFPPYFIHRRPRSISAHHHHWKASELRHWLLFYALPCLKNVMSEPFLTHFSCLVEGTYILLQEGITPEDLQRANLLLVIFVKNVQVLYGKRYMSMNVHNILHLPALVEKWGPLWSWSCFPFESYNGDVINSIHGKGNVCKDVFWHLQSHKRVNLKAQDLPEESRTSQFLQKMLESKIHRNAQNARQCTVIKQEPVRKLDANEEQYLKEENGDCNKELYMVCNKISRNGFLMYSKKCSKISKQNSYTILLDKVDSDECPTAIEVLRYIMHQPTQKVYAVGQLLRGTDLILRNRVPHIRRYERGSNTLVKVEKLQEPLIVMNITDEMYCAKLPNHMETD